MLDIFEVMNYDGNVNQLNNKKEIVLYLVVLEGYYNIIRCLVYLKVDLEVIDLKGNIVFYKLVMKMVSDLNNISCYLRFFEVIVE